MARSFAGGTDQLYWTRNFSMPLVGCVAFKMKTTQTTSNTSVLSDWSGSSRNGFGLFINNVANKITAQGYDATTARITLVSTTSVNSGNWHSAAFNFNRNNGGANALFVDGVSEATGNSAAAWGGGSGFNIGTGILNGFWAAYVGEIAEIGYWGANLDAAELAALAKDYSPRLIRPASLLFHAPVVREIGERRVGLAGNPTGGGVSVHPRVLGAVT